MVYILTLIRNHGIELAFCVLSALSLSVSGFMAYRVHSDTQRSILAVKEVHKPGPESEAHKTIAVDISGEVENPGTVELKSGSRLYEALDRSGGVTKNASLEYIQKMLNLSQILQDEQKIYIPSEEDYINDLNAGEQSVDVNNTPDVHNLVNINQADSTTLEKLPGIGPVTAQKIIQGRPYSSFEELAEKKVMSESVLEKIRDLASL